MVLLGPVEDFKQLLTNLMPCVLPYGDAFQKQVSWYPLIRDAPACGIVELPRNEVAIALPW